MRGRLKNVPVPQELQRSIPAYAGEAILARVDAGETQVDPRVCGGGIPVIFSSMDKPGRSPRMRGRLRSGSAWSEDVGSIPAYAGEASESNQARKVFRVDPRVCGGGVIRSIIPCSAAGRSPRMRGRRSHKRPTVTASGSIPAYAGEAPRSPVDDIGHGVDPRVCGGGRVAAFCTWLDRGRSPRMRGRL